jgi:hypothetical protein
MQRKHLMTAASVAIASCLFSVTLSSEGLAATFKFKPANTASAFTLVQEGRGGGAPGGAMSRGGRQGGAIGQRQGAQGAGRNAVRRPVVHGGRTVVGGRRGIRRRAFFRGGRNCFINCRDAGFGPGFCRRRCF